MPVDGVVMQSIRKELNQKLNDAKLERISMNDRHTIVLFFYSRGHKSQLLIGVNPAMPELRYGQNLQDKSLNPPPAFLLTLRKYLLGGRLISVDSEAYERSLNFSFEVLDDLGDLKEKHLIVEFMNRVANIVLVNSHGIIHTALRLVDHSVNRYRETLPAHPYKSPPPQNKLRAEDIQNLSYDQVFLHQKSNDDLSSAVYKNIAGFSPLLGREVAFRAGLDSRMSYEKLEKADKEKLYHALLLLCTEIVKNEPKAMLYYDLAAANSKRKLVDIHTVQLTQFKHTESYDSTLLAVSEYYRQIKEDSLFQKKKDQLSRLLSERIRKLTHKQELHESDLLEGSKANDYKLYGELILSNLHLIKNSENNVWVKNYYDNNNILEIKLDPRYSPAKNANRYFASYARNKRRFGQAEKLLRQDRTELDYLNSIAVNLHCATEQDDLLAIEDELNEDKIQHIKTEDMEDRSIQEPGKPASKKRRQARLDSSKAKKKKENKPIAQALAARYFRSSDGLTIIAGRNNKQNDQITFHKARKDDLWFHIKDAPGAHVIIIAEGKTVPEQTITEAAGLAAWFAGSNRAGAVKSVVDYCEVRNVRKIKGARPGQVIYDNHQSLLILPLDPAKLEKIQ